MFDALKNFIAEVSGTESLARRFDEEDYRLAAVALFTSVLRRALDDDGRQKIVEMLWDIAYADGAADEFEENTIWRIAELLGVSTRDRVLLRQRVAGRASRTAPFEGPLSAAAAKGEG
jgi:uncharacterized tellurite resistance protein B-like protein